MPLPRPFDVRVGNCSCISDTSAIPGGRMTSTSPQGWVYGVSWQGHTNAEACTNHQPHPTETSKKIAHGANRWAIKNRSWTQTGQHNKLLHVEDDQIVDHRRALLPYHVDIALQHHLGTARQHLDRLDPGA